MYIFIFILIVSSCSTNNHINKFVDKKTYGKQFKNELFKRCVFQNSIGDFHNNIAVDLYGKLPPPPPFYLRPSKNLIDSISIIEKKPYNIIENCFNLVHSKTVEKIINNEYKNRKIKEIIE